MIYSENILICIALPLLISVLFTEKNTRRFIISFISGMAVCLLSAYISGFIRYVSWTAAEDMAVYYAPMVEEIMKMLPLIFYIFVFLPADEEQYTVALGIGLGFATFENCCYILAAGASELMYVVIRGLAAGGMHVVCAIILAIGISTAKHFNALAFPGVCGALSLSMIFHGLYNLLVSEPGVSTWIGYAMPLVTAAVIYLPFKKDDCGKKYL